MVDEKRLMKKLDEINRNLVKLTALVSLSGRDDKERAKVLSKIRIVGWERRVGNLFASLTESITSRS